MEDGTKGTTVKEGRGSKENDKRTKGNLALVEGSLSMLW